MSGEGENEAARLLAIGSKSVLDQDFAVAIDLEANFINASLVEGGADEDMRAIDLDKPLLLYN